MLTSEAMRQAFGDDNPTENQGDNRARLYFSHGQCGEVWRSPLFAMWPKTIAGILADLRPVWIGDPEEPREGWFRFEHHTGDDNDNSISEVIIEARSRGEAFDRLPTLDKEHPPEELESHGYTVDGDDYSLTQLWFEYYTADGENIEPSDVPENAEIDEPDSEYGSTPFHDDFHLSGEYSTEAEADKARATYHANDGIVYLN